MNSCDLRHVCFKDLEDYFKKSDYFKGLNPDEQAIIRKNLGISFESAKIELISGSYEDINYLKETSLLGIGNKYVIEDFLTIYSCNGEVLGTDNSRFPSLKYKIMLTAISNNSFDNNVKILNARGVNWDVRYSIGSNTYYDSKLGRDVTTKGTITYLKDDNNNSAYFDFKNKRWFRDVSVLNKGKVTYSESRPMLTFSVNDVDISNGVDCKNNHLEKGCENIVCLSTTQNNTFEADCNNITFFAACENNKFYYGTHDVQFTDVARMLKGAVHDITIGEISSISAPKEFNVLDGKQILLYLDSQTQTFQVHNL